MKPVAKIFSGRATYIGFYLLLVIALYVIALHFAEFQEVLVVLKRAKPGWIAVALILQILTYAAAGMAMRQILHTLGYRFSLWFMYKLDLAMLFLSHTIPSGAFTGVIYMIRVLKRRQVPQSQGTITSLILMATGYVGFFLLIAVGFIFTAGVERDLFPTQTVAIALLGALLFILFADRVIAKRQIVGKFIHWILKHTRFHGKFEKGMKRLQQFIEEIASGRELFLQSKSKFVPPTLAQFLVLFFDCLTLMVIFYAFEFNVPLAVIILSYATARFIGAASLLPGGLGSFDAAQIFMLKALGVPLASATLVTLVFRFFAYWIPTPVGLHFWRQLLKDNRPMVE